MGSSEAVGTSEVVTSEVGTGRAEDGVPCDVGVGIGRVSLVSSPIHQGVCDEVDEGCC